MNGLELYAKIEQYLDFSDEVAKLHNLFLGIVDEISPKTLLDIGCGQGGFLNQLDSSIESFGIDLSQNQITIAKSKNLCVECMDLKELNKNFDMQTAIFDVINYIPPKELNSFFNKCYQTLNQNGYFVFDINTLFGFDEIAQGSLAIDKDEIFISVDAYFEDNILNTHITTFNKNSDNCYTKEQGTNKQNYHTNEFLKKELLKIGFEIEQILDFRLHSINKADKQIFICKK